MKKKKRLKTSSPKIQPRFTSYQVPKDPVELKKLILEDSDFINSKRHGFSLKGFIAKNGSKNITDEKICKFLGLSPEEYKQHYETILKLFKQEIGNEFEDDQNQG